MHFVVHNSGLSGFRTRARGPFAGAGLGLARGQSRHLHVGARYLVAALIVTNEKLLFVCDDLQQRECVLHF